jgi:hypothetical protein
MNTLKVSLSKSAQVLCITVNITLKINETRKMELAEMRFFRAAAG